MDIMEANKFSWRTTPHTCDGNGPHYWNCDRGGQVATDLQQKGVFGEGKKINSDQPFHVKIEFGNTSYKLTLTQGSNVDVSEVNDSYMGGMANALNGNSAFIMSSWGADDGISWLQHGACQGSGDCNHNLHFSNIKIVQGSGPPPPPPGNWEFGDACASKSDDFCDGSCDCRWSWPKGSSWNDPNAACRCKA